MFSFNIKVLAIFFLCSLKCLTKREKELIEKLRNQKSSSICCHKSKEHTIVLKIYLYIKTKDGIIGRMLYSDTLEDSSSDICFSMEMYDEDAISKVIKRLEKNKGANHRIKIFFYYGKEELQKYNKYFMKRCEENNISQIEISLREVPKVVIFRGMLFFIELHDNKIVILTKRLHEGNSYIDKIKVSNEYLDNFMEMCLCLWNSYFKSSEFCKCMPLFKKYFYNHKLLSYNLDYFNDESYLLNRFKSEATTYSKRKEDVEFNIDEYFKGCDLKNMPSIKCVNVIFHFFQDSEFLEDMVKDSIRDKKSDKFDLFRKVLKDLEIGLDEILNGLVETDNVITVKSKTIDDNVLSIILNKIRAINIEDHIRNYKKLSIYFYLYLRKINLKYLNELIEMVKKVVLKEDFKNDKTLIFNKLIKYIGYIYDCDIVYGCNDIFYEKELSSNS